MHASLNSLFLVLSSAALLTSALPVQNHTTSANQTVELRQRKPYAVVDIRGPLSTGAPTQYIPAPFTNHTAPQQPKQKRSTNQTESDVPTPLSTGTATKRDAFFAFNETSSRHFPGHGPANQSVAAVRRAESTGSPALDSQSPGWLNETATHRFKRAPAYSVVNVEPSSSAPPTKTEVLTHEATVTATLDSTQTATETLYTTVITSIDATTTMYLTMTVESTPAISTTSTPLLSSVVSVPSPSSTLVGSSSVPVETTTFYSTPTAVVPQPANVTVTATPITTAAAITVTDIVSATVSEPGAITTVLAPYDNGQWHTSYPNRWTTYTKRAEATSVLPSETYAPSGAALPTLAAVPAGSQRSNYTRSWRLE